MEQVILVNEADEAVGLMEKMRAHELGLLHRAVSLFVVNSRGEMLLQQRALHKYHSGGLWTNACCSHPREGESPLQAVSRRIQEEMGFSCEPRFLFSFIYRAELDQNLQEHELDHVFMAIFDGIPQPNPEEVAAYKFVPIPELNADMAQNPGHYTAWFKIIWDEYQHHF